MRRHGNHLTETEIMHQDLTWLARCVYLSSLCTPIKTAFNVGAIITDLNGHYLSSGYSRELGQNEHAEECALSKISKLKNPNVQDLKLYTSMIPCSNRASKKLSCFELIRKYKIIEVVYLIEEPLTFVKNESLKLAINAGINLRSIPENNHKKRLAELALKLMNIQFL